MEETKLKWVFCHRKPERSFFWRGKRFPLCARCTGIYVSYILIFPFFLFDVFRLNIWWGLLLLLPAYVDGITQVFLHRESNNIIRVTSGMIMGVGVASIASLIGEYIGHQILLIF